MEISFVHAAGAIYPMKMHGANLKMLPMLIIRRDNIKT
jgi:hypothetical protein